MNSESGMLYQFWSEIMKIEDHFLKLTLACAETQEDRAKLAKDYPQCFTTFPYLNFPFPISLLANRGKHYLEYWGEWDESRKFPECVFYMIDHTLKEYNLPEFSFFHPIYHKAEKLGDDCPMFPVEIVTPGIKQFDILNWNNNQMIVIDLDYDHRCTPTYIRVLPKFMIDMNK